MARVLSLLSVLVDGKGMDLEASAVLQTSKVKSHAMPMQGSTSGTSDPYQKSSGLMFFDGGKLLLTTTCLDFNDPDIECWVKAVLTDLPVEDLICFRDDDDADDEVTDDDCTQQLKDLVKDNYKGVALQSTKLLTSYIKNIQDGSLSIGRLQVSPAKTTFHPPSKFSRLGPDTRQKSCGYTADGEPIWFVEAKITNLIYKLKGGGKLGLQQHCTQKCLTDLTVQVNPCTIRQSKCKKCTSAVCFKGKGKGAVQDDKCTAQLKQVKKKKSKKILKVFFDQLVKKDLQIGTQKHMEATSVTEGVQSLCSWIPGFFTCEQGCEGTPYLSEC